ERIGRIDGRIDRMIEILPILPILVQTTTDNQQSLIRIPQRNPVRPRVTEYACVVTGVASRRKELFKIIGVRHVARPYEEGEAFRGAETSTCIQHRVAINIYVLGRCRA